MKKVIFSAFALGLIVMSCQKETIEPIDVSNEEEVIDNYQLKSYDGATRKTVPVILEGETEPFDVFCVAGGTNCFEEVVVTGMHYAMIGGLIDVINLGVDEDIKDEFYANRIALKKYISKSLIDSVINEVYTVQNFGDLDDDAFFTFHNSSGAMIVTCELVK